MAFGQATKSHKANKLLSALDHEDFTCLEPHLEVISLHHGQVLAETGDPLQYAYFPHDVIISLVAVMENGSCAEMSVCGREGVAGFVAAALSRQSFGRYVVQLSGTASRINMDKLHEVLQSCPNIQRLMRQFMEALTSRILQNVACNALHSVEARCARLILSTRYRIDQDVMPLTHEFWAERLGVQRTTVSAVMGKLQTAGLIRQGRGGITITDPAALKEAACECYTKVHDVYVRLLTYTTAKS